MLIIGVLLTMNIERLKEIRENKDLYQKDILKNKKSRVSRD